MVVQACLQEGVALGAITLAGHWRLQNLTIVYDNNQVICNGTADVIFSKDINTKMTARGWHVIDVSDGVSNVEAIIHALTYAMAKQEQSTSINARTAIGFNVYERVLALVLPKLIGPLESEGRMVKPWLLHGYLWDGNIRVDN